MSISCWSSSPYVHLTSFTWLILQGILQFSCSSVSMYTIWWENLAVANILKMLDLLLWKFCSLQSCLAWTRWLTLPLCVTALSSSCVKKNLSNMASSELSSTSSLIALEDEQSYGCHAVRHIVVCSPLCVWHTLLQNNSTSTSHSLMAQANRLDCVVETMSLTHDQDLIFGSSLVQTFILCSYLPACLWKA